MYIFLNLGSWTQSNRPYKYKEPSCTISRKSPSLYFVTVRCFSRFQLLCPLQTKHSDGVKENIKKIFTVHGMPETLQPDDGKEFKGSVKLFCRMKKIRMVQFWPYNPRVQGQVERSRRVLRNKILFDMVSQMWSSTNWVKILQNYIKCINNGKREELGWQCPFEFYFGGNSNELVRCGLPENRGSPLVGS